MNSNMMRHGLILLFLCLASLVFAQESGSSAFGENIFGRAEDKGQVERRLEEASGLAASFKNPGCFWVINDSDNPAQVFLIDGNAKTKITCSLEGISNRDWEDVAIGSGPKPGKKYVYVAEIGDNLAQYALKYLYRFEEPSADNGTEQTITGVETLIVKLPDGKRDTEALMIDPITNDIYIISKREEKARVYLQKYPYPKDTLRPVKVLELPFNWVTCASISPDGKEVLIKNYPTIYYWKRTKEKSLVELLSKKPIEIPYDPEPQGEAICFANDGSGFYTVSETREKKPLAELKFYKRK